ncbi:MAG: hypothetical protein K9L75_02980 [Spirochaetia bacterium]|nr:hypothetical protein [Spirochaetia bacterium]
MVIMKPKSNVRKTTYAVLQTMPAGRVFSSHQLRHEVMKRIWEETGQHRAPFHDTILRYLREKRHELDIHCVNRGRSMYIKYGWSKLQHDKNLRAVNRNNSDQEDQGGNTSRRQKTKRIA